MKQFKFLALALTLLMGITFTSCLDSDNESTYDVAGFVRVNSIYGQVVLKDLSGAMLVPTASSLAAVKQQGIDLASYKYDLIFAYLKWADTAQNQGKAASRSVELVGVQPIAKGSFDRVPTMEQLMTAKEAPVVTLKPMMNSFGNTAEPWLYGSELVVLPIQWKMENKQETVKEHTFALHYVEGASDNETMQGNRTLALYLLHDKGNDPETDAKKLANAYDNFSFDVQTILNNYKAKHGAFPEKVVIKAKCAQDGFTMPKPQNGDAESIWTDFEINSSSLNKTQN